MPCRIRKALNGLRQAPVSRSTRTRARSAKARAPKGLVEVSARDSWGRAPRTPAKRPLSQGNCPPSTRMPPIELPCPPRYLVRLCMTMSAPCSMGRHSAGEAVVLSITTGTPRACATCGDAGHVGDGQLGVADRLQVDRLGAVGDGLRKGLRLIAVHPDGVDAHARQACRRAASPCRRTAAWWRRSRRPAAAERE